MEAAGASREPRARPAHGGRRSAGRLILIRHAETAPEWGLPAETWGLSSTGAAQAEALARASFWPEIRALYSSDEPKAVATARPAAVSHGLRLRLVPGVREVRRPVGRLEDYDAAVRGYLGGTGRWPGWEPLAAAELRVWRSIGRILRAHPEGYVAIVSHGLVLALYACRLLGLRDRYGFWRTIPFAGWARVQPETGTLVKDFA